MAVNLIKNIPATEWIAARDIKDWDTIVDAFWGNCYVTSFRRAIVRTVDESIMVILTVDINGGANSAVLSFNDTELVRVHV